MDKTVKLDKIRVLQIPQKEKHRFSSLMQQYHYLGFKQGAGEQVYHAAVYEGQWVALLGWSTGVFQNKDRDEFIGWSALKRHRRLKYIAGNFRFLILPTFHQKNLASKVLSLSLKRLSSDFKTRYNHPIYLAETFIDPERFTGACYKASNFFKLGKSKGYRRHNGQYIYHGKSKDLYAYILDPKGIAQLKRADKLDSDEKECPMIDWRKLPIAKKNGLLSLMTSIPDFRKGQGRSQPLRTVLCVAVCAMLSGARTYDAMGEWAKKLSLAQLKRMGSFKLKPPSTSTIQRILKGIDAEIFDEKVYAWLWSLIDKPSPKVIAFDGKTLRGSFDGMKKSVHLLSAVLQEEQVTIYQEKVSSKTNEIPVMQEAIKKMDIKDAIITADALHTQEETARLIVKEKKADYLFTVKDNQKKLNQELKQLSFDFF